MKKEGYAVTQKDVSAACRYLEGKGLILVKSVKNDVLKINRDIAHIMPDGVDVLEGTKTVEGIELNA